MAKSKFSDAVPLSLALEEYTAYVDAHGGLGDEKPRQSWIADNYIHLLSEPAAWPTIHSNQIESSEDDMYANTNLRQAFWDLGFDGGDGETQQWKRTILDDYVEEIAKKVQFPHDTAYLFALGAVASAMTRQFTYQISNDEYTRAPVNLYVVAAQPAGTGKSGVLRNLVRPIELSYASLNKNQASKRGVLLAKEEMLKADIKKAQNENEKAEMIRELTELQQEIRNTPIYIYSVDDATPESLRNMAAAQCGFFNLISEESNLVNVLLGSVYGDGRRKNNNGMFLKAWDGETVSVARAGQDVITTEVRATLAVIAQDQAIQAILKAGQEGTGINERVLIIRERDMLGRVDIRARHEQSVNEYLRARYQKMIDRMVNAEPDGGITSFVISDQAREVLISYEEMQQIMMRNRDSIFSDPSMIGVLSKATKQICKIASILHGCQIFQDDGVPSREINEVTMRRAIGIFYELINAYAKKVVQEGYGGQEPRMQRVMEYFDRVAAKPINVRGGGKLIKTTISQIKDSMRKTDVFARCHSVDQTIRHEILPKLERDGHIAIVGDRIFINPWEYG